MIKKIVVILILVILAFVIRAPYFYNYEARDVFHSDIVVEFLHMKHIHEGKHFKLFYYGQNYQGIVEGLFNFAFQHFVGFNALTNLFAPTLFYLMFLFSITVLGWIMFAPWVGILALMFGAIPSPIALNISMWAIGSHVMVLGVGSFAVLIYYLFTTGRIKISEKIFFLLFGIYFGFFHFGYSFTSIYFLSLLAHYVFKIKKLKVSFKSFRIFFDTFLIFIKNAFSSFELWLIMVGFLFGLSPAIISSLFMDVKNAGFNIPTQLPFIGTIMFHLELLLTETLPLILGVNFFENRSVMQTLGEGRATVLKHSGKIFFLIYTAIIWHPIWRLARKKQVITDKNLNFIKFLLFCILAFYIFTPFAKNASSVRYLLPSLTFFTISAAFYLNLIFKHNKYLGVGLVIIFFAYSGLTYYHNFRSKNFINKNATLNKVHIDEKDIIKYMKANNLKGGYADYWVSYRLNYFSNEEIIFGAFNSIERNIEYAKIAKKIKNPVYVCHKSEPDRCKDIEKHTNLINKIEFKNHYLYKK